SQEQCEDNDTSDDEEEADAEESEDDASDDKKDEKEKASDKKVSIMAAKASSSFKKGDRSKEIAAIKKKMNKIGFGGMNINNLFGSFTETRVKQFQKEYGIKQSGKLNQKTINKINDIYNSPLQVGKKHKDMIDLK